MASTVPSWVVINSSTGALTITAPEVSSDAEFSFYIVSSVSGISDPIKKLIKLTILNWSVSNWQKCISTNRYTCETWNKGFTFDHGECTTYSETAKALSKTNVSVVSATLACVIFVSFLNSSSVANLWLTINQVQIFFLLFLTKAFIPDDIKEVIIGPEFALNIFEYIPFKRIGLYPSVMKSFEFNLTTSILDPFEIKYESTIANSYSIFIWMIFIIMFHFWLWILKWLLSKWKESDNCIFKVINWIVEKIFIIMTFGFYIRNTLEISQFILISSIYEIYLFKTTESMRCISLAFASLLLLCYILILFVVNYFILFKTEPEESIYKKFSEFFSCLKENRKPRFYITMLLLRKLLFVTLLIVLESIQSKQIIGILMIIQLLYLIFMS